MGMFDYVDYSAPCWKCGEQLTEWQSKDANCFMEKIKPEATRLFYGRCEKCETWNEYKVVPTAFKIVPDDARDLEGCCPQCRRPYNA